MLSTLPVAPLALSIKTEILGTSHGPLSNVRIHLSMQGTRDRSLNLGTKIPHAMGNQAHELECWNS